MTDMFIKELWRYPIKGCAGEKVETLQVGQPNFNYDRNWMVVDENGMFVAQRAEGAIGVGHREMCLVRANVRTDHLNVTAPQMPLLVAPLEARSTELCDVQVWSWSGKAKEVSRASSDWFTEYLNRFDKPDKKKRYRLVQSVGLDRAVDGSLSHLAFADGYPVLVLSQASLDHLNTLIDGSPVGMDRFRPNIVLGGEIQAHAEDKMELLRSDRGIILMGRKLCDRCSVPAIDQKTATVDSRPLTALATYRTWPDANGKNKVWLGRNFTLHSAGTLGQYDKIKAI